MHRFLTYPFAFALGFFPERMLAPFPSGSLIYANFVFVTMSLLSWNTPNWQFGVLNTAINWCIIQVLFYRRWQVAILLAWAATDFLYLTTGLYSIWIEGYVFFVLLARDLSTRTGVPQ